MAKEWRVELRGEKLDIDELRKVSSSDFQIYETEGSFSLSAGRFATLTDPREVMASGRELICILNGIGAVLFDNWENVLVAGVYKIDENGRRDLFLLANTIRGRSRVSANLTIVAASSPPQPAKPPIDRVLARYEIASKHVNVTRALNLFGRERGWFDLYKVFEIIREDVGGERTLERNGFVEKEEISAFTGTANNASVLGDVLARHAKRGGVPSTTMSLEDAQKFISRLLEVWIKSKP